MFVLNDDLSIYVTRGDVVRFTFQVNNDDKNYKFQPGEVVRFKVYGKKNAESVVLQKDFPITEYTESVEIYLSKEDTKIGGIISKPTDYWYEVELNPFDETQTIVGYDEDGAKLFRLFPEGGDAEEYKPTEKDFPVVDSELDMTSERPIANQAISRAYQALLAGYEATHAAVADLHVTPQMFGAIGDGEADDTEAFQEALDTKRKLYVPNGVYKVTAPLTAYNSIEFEKDAYIEFYPGEVGATCIKISGSVDRLYENLTCQITETALKALRLSNFTAGDYIYLSNNEIAAPTAREYDTKRDILQIHSFASGTITFTTAPEHEYTSVNIDKMNLVDNIIIDGAKIRCIGDYASTNGIVLEYAKNATVRNCHISNFDNGQIILNYCTLCDVYSNHCEVDYSDSLQYGIVIFSSSNISVYGNKVNSYRTAIDVTRLSNKVTVTGNTVKGHINTHSATNVNITNNTINDGMILIRGKNILVSGNNVDCYDQNCIDIEEMGIEGGHIITNNVFKGFCSMKCYLSNVSITGNHFIVTKVLSYGDGAYESVIRLMSGGTPSKTDGAVISGNTFETVKITPIYCIEANSNMSTIHNLVIQDNVIRGFRTALYLPQKSADNGENLIVKNNLMIISEYGVVFRFTYNTQITGNTIIGTNKGEAGINRLSATDEAVGLIVRDNFIKNFNYGFKVDGTGDIQKAVYMNNVFQNVNFNDFAIGTNLRRIPNDLFVSSPNGTIYHLKAGDDGVLTLNAQSYT